jgi:tyrosyl-tRNA synthetase
LDREDFKNRLNNQLEIRAHEILYPMMQAYDSVVLESDVEIGGIDQKLNILAGRQLQEASKLKPQVAILAPLLIGLDGHKKMSKSVGNYIGLNDKPEDMYGKVMSLKDDLMTNYFKLVLGYSDDEVYTIEKKIQDGENPMMFKKQLAYEIVETFYSKKEADLAGGSFTKVFSNREIPTEMPEVVINGSSAALFEIIRSGIPTEEMTSSEIKRLIMQNSIKINDKAIGDPYHKIKLSPEGVVIKIGKRRWLKAIGK